MKIVVIAPPDMLPEALASSPDVVVIDPATLGEDLIAQLDVAAGGMLSEEGMPQEGGEGELSEWASEEEREHGMGGRGEDEDGTMTGGEGDEEEEDPMGRGEEEPPSRAAPSAQRGRGGRGPSFGVTISGRGAAIPALSRWAAGMGAIRR